MGTIPGSDASSTAAGAGETVNQPDYKQLYETAKQQAESATKTAEEFQTRHRGLQGKYQQEQEKWVRDTDSLMKSQDQLKTLMGEKEALLLERDTLARTATEKAAEATKAAAQAARIKLIASQHPELLSFEADGLLPEGVGDDFAAKLTKFAEKLAGKGAAAVTEFRSGEAPQPPREAVAGTSAALFQQAYSAQRAGKFDEYNRLYDSALKLKRDGK